MFYLIDSDSGRAVWCGVTEPALDALSCVCDDITFTCYNQENAHVIEADPVEFVQNKFIQVGKNIVQDPAWIDSDIKVMPTMRDYRDAIEKYLNEEAQKRHYDSIITAALRAGYPGPFHVEGVKFATWMDACWAKSFEIQALVLAGQRAQPTVAELLAEMPALNLDEVTY